MFSSQEEKMYIVKDVLKSDFVFIFYNFKYLLSFKIPDTYCIILTYRVSS